jgi:hypothetical protein
MVSLRDFHPPYDNICKTKKKDWTSVKWTQEFRKMDESSIPF